ncbi:hypothetical protein SAMN05216276_102140 [Streptosporangium subroseum]|uniref:Uncharacterized protein n=1 Tax=Streptosporangium subroseum TaxID=106412 RepID=A0A239IZ79_9ACTN|nr:hypothetical protein SAMN05216276_102140 [Streptosporangium subroseum]
MTAGFLADGRPPGAVPAHHGKNHREIKRAVVVGERTEGVLTREAATGWTPPGGRRTGRAINPITDTDREGAGITPDIETPAGPAFGRAHELAPRHVAA